MQVNNPCVGWKCKRLSLVLLTMDVIHSSSPEKCLEKLSLSLLTSFPMGAHPCLDTSTSRSCLTPAHLPRWKVSIPPPELPSKCSSTVHLVRSINHYSLFNTCQEQRLTLMIIPLKNLISLSVDA